MEDIEFIQNNMIFVLEYQMLISRNSEDLHFTWKCINNFYFLMRIPNQFQILDGVVIGLCLTTLVSFMMHFEISMISSSLELGIFGTNTTFQKRTPKNIEEMKSILFLSENGNAGEWLCPEVFNTYNIEDFEFMTERMLI